MIVLVSGSTGLVGSAVIGELARAGHTIRRLVRRASESPNDVLWDPVSGAIDGAALEGIDAVVHLAGDNIAEGRWNAEKKALIRDSRVNGTSLLASTLAGLQQRPKTLVCASAIGYYGDRGPDVMTEESTAAADFLGQVCLEWEQAAEPARAAGIRVVHTRIGVVLSLDGGALAKQLLPFKLCLGGVIGSGDQYISWIALDDLAAVIRFAVENESVEGPVNAVSPDAVTNRVYTKTLGRVLSRPTLFPMPAFAARLAFGEMADALLLSSTRVEPARLKALGYAFRHPELEAALREIVGGGEGGERRDAKRET
jgi:hypothetical protein